MDSGRETMRQWRWSNCSTGLSLRKNPNRPRPKRSRFSCPKEKRPERSGLFLVALSAAAENCPPQAAISIGTPSRASFAARTRAPDAAAFAAGMRAPDAAAFAARMRAPDAAAFAARMRAPDAAAFVAWILAPESAAFVAWI